MWLNPHRFPKENKNMAQSQQQLEFAYWVPNVSGGLVVSNIELMWV